MRKTAIAIWIATGIAIAVIAIEATFLARKGMSAEAQGHATKIVFEKLCANAAGNGKAALTDALRYSMKFPIDLPPWRVIYLAATAKTSDTPSDLAVCALLQSPIKN